jgi:hypothetical protein
MPVGGQAAIVAAVAFVIGIGIGLMWGPFSSRDGEPIPTPVARPVAGDAGRPATASSTMIPPTPPDASGVPPEPHQAIDAGLDTTQRDDQPPPTQPVDPGQRKRSNQRDGSKHKVAPILTPDRFIQPIGSPD